MKKILATTYLIIIFILNINMISYAESFSEDGKAALNSLNLGIDSSGDDQINKLLNALEDSRGDNECLPEDIIGGKYIYTIVEEPLSPNNIIKKQELQKLVDNDEEFITKSCYRNTVEFNLKVNKNTAKESWEGISLHSLSNICSENGKNLFNTFINNDDVKVAFDCKLVEVYLSQGGTSMIEGYIKRIYTIGASLVGLISVAVIIISGLQISLSAGDSGAIDEAKNRIIRSLLGIALLFLSGLVLYVVNPNFYTKSSTTHIEQNK